MGESCSTTSVSSSKSEGKSTVTSSKIVNTFDHESKSSSADDKNAVRANMKNYWEEHAKESLTNSLMLLMKDGKKAEIFAANEKAEILSYLPNINVFVGGLRILEIGAGIGRFTGNLAQNATSVLAVDFCQKFLTENEAKHGHIYPQIEFICKDVCKLVLNDETHNLVFSNWLFMYLSDDEVMTVAQNMYKWCMVGGYVFFRESCAGGASGDKPRTSNPTFYRDWEFYERLFSGIPGLKKVHVKQIKIYVDQKQKNNQYCFLYKKIH